MHCLGAGALFYWYFEPPATKGPLLLWLQGGPGASSMPLSGARLDLKRL